MAAPAPVIDVSGAIDTALTSVTTPLNENAGKALAIGGGLLALGVAWKLVRKFAK
jgi:hypothetical protein